MCLKIQYKNNRGRRILGTYKLFPIISGLPAHVQALAKSPTSSVADQSVNYKITEWLIDIFKKIAYNLDHDDDLA